MHQVEIPEARVWMALPVPPGSGGGVVSLGWAQSCGELERLDRINGWNHYRGQMAAVSGANISKARNDLCRRFLDETDGDWLWFVDSDMSFEADTLARLLCAAKLADCTVIGGLCVMVGGDGPIPTIYQMGDVSRGEVTRVMLDFPDDQIVQVAATGAACLLIHRSALEAIQALHPDNPFPWFGEVVINGQWVSEDLTFCLRANEAGHRVYVDTTTKIGHWKHGRLWHPDDIRQGIGFPEAKTYAVIPSRTRGLASATVAQLAGQVDQVVILDNTDTGELADLDAVVLHTPGAGIHEMWNRGIDWALEDAKQKRNVNVLVLNDDLELHDGFVSAIVAALRSDPLLVAVSGNYDGRDVDGPVQITEDICAGRYDGTGGFAGFAFAVRGEWLHSGYRFPEECTWWFGDNDLVLAARFAGGRVGIARDARVTHLDGGGKTGRWDDPELRPILDADRAAFETRWARIHEAA